jgi:hypothetical protein
MIKESEKFKVIIRCFGRQMSGDYVSRWREEEEDVRSGRRNTDKKR